MKLRFEPDLPHQAAAVAAVADLFRGQEIGRTEFTVTRTAAAGAQAAMGLDETALGVGNRLLLTPEALIGFRGGEASIGKRGREALVREQKRA